MGLFSDMMDEAGEKDTEIARLRALEGMLLLCGELGGPNAGEPLEQYLRRLIDGLIDARADNERLQREVAHWSSLVSRADHALFPFEQRSDT